MKTSGKCRTESVSYGSSLGNVFNYLHTTFIRTKPPEQTFIRTKPSKRSRRKKSKEDLKTLYYYRDGRLKIDFVDNSGLGLYAGVYVFIKKYSKERDQFLIEDIDGQQTWTDIITPVCPSISGYEVYHTCFEFLARQNIRNGQMVCYRTKNGFAFLKKEIQTCSFEYVLYKNGRLNIDNIPKCYNFALGYSENESPQNNLKTISYPQINKLNLNYGEST